MRIRFLSDQIYEQGGPGKGPRFAQDRVIDEADVQEALGLAEAPSAEFASAFLQRWVQRGVAEEVDGRTPLTRDAAKVAAPAPEAKQEPVTKPPVVSQPLGTAARGRPTAGLDDGKRVKASDKK